MMCVLGPVTLVPQLPLRTKGVARVRTGREIFSLSSGAGPSSGYCRVALTSINSLDRQHLEAGAWKGWR